MLAPPPGGLAPPPMGILDPSLYVVCLAFPILSRFGEDMRGNQHTLTRMHSVECKPPACRKYGLYKI